jgi:hypothetical protein
MLGQLGPPRAQTAIVGLGEHDLHTATLAPMPIT